MCDRDHAKAATASSRKSPEDLKPSDGETVLAGQRCAW